MATGPTNIGAIVALQDACAEKDRSIRTLEKANGRLGVRISTLEQERNELRLLAVDLAKGRPITADRHRILTGPTPEGE
jgi:hypothetical protein